MESTDSHHSQQAASSSSSLPVVRKKRTVKRKVGKVGGKARRATRSRAVAAGGPALQETLQQRQERVKEKISRLSEQQSKDILLQCCELQPAVIFDIMDRVDPPTPEGYHPPPQAPSPDWCVCTRCREMPTAMERRCCGYQDADCTSISGDFEEVCLRRNVLVTAAAMRNDIIPVRRDQDNSQKMRHTAYRQYIYFTHGRLGQGQRHVIPSCCVWRIRDSFPNPFGAYVGFIPTRLV